MKNPDTTELATGAAAPAAPAAADLVPANLAGGWNIPGDVVAAGVAKQPPNFQADLRFSYEYAHAQGWSLKEAAERYGVDVTTLSRLYRGEYRSHQKNHVLPPPAVMLSFVREIRSEVALSTAKRKDRVLTPTVQAIWQRIDKAWQQRVLCFIYGESHFGGKTEALLWYRDDHNHGMTVYVDLQHCHGVQDVWRAFARALHLSADCPAYKLVPRIHRALKADGEPFSRRLVILDEFHAITYAYKKKSSVLVINALKAIKDAAQCGMVICGTPVARDEIAQGRESNLLKQIKRRGVLELNLPDAVTVGDTRAFARHYGLEFPEPPAAGDLWRHLRAEHPDAPHIEALDSIAHDHGLLRLRCTLDDARHLAAKAKRAITWADFVRAHRIYEKSAQKPEA